LRKTRFNGRKMWRNAGADRFQIKAYSETISEPEYSSKEHLVCEKKIVGRHLNAGWRLVTMDV